MLIMDGIFFDANSYFTGALTTKILSWLLILLTDLKL